MQTYTTVDLMVRVNGNNVATFSHEGKTFVEGRSDTEYSLFVRNPHPYRVKVVLSVDQINVVSGKPATGEPDETGYILNAGESTTILGYRLDDNAVARFRFTRAEGAYASTDKGLKGTTGVIGCRAYSERTPPPAPVVKEIHHHYDHWYEDPWWPYRPYRTYPIWCGGSNITYETSNAGGFSLDASNSAPLYACSATPDAGSQMSTMAYSSQNAQSEVQSNPFTLGSTFGTKAESTVTRVGFEVGEFLGQTEVYYTTREGLIALGVDITRKPKVAFPSAFGSGGYCTPPRDWVG